jgi:hypothetical protein
MASVGISRRFQAISGASEISKVQCSAVQKHGSKRIEDRLEGMWQFVYR